MSNSTSQGPVTPTTHTRNPWRIAVIVILSLALLGVAIGGGIWWGGRNSGNNASGVAGPAIGSGTASGNTDIIAVPINTADNPFTPAAGSDVKITPAKVDAPTVVPGGQVGLYGGSLNIASCDREQLIGFLATNPEKATAWAGVVGIAVADIAPFVRRLTSVILRADTIVVNHGYANGAVTSFLSVLQAGTAVLVNDRGQPVVRCFCGNPLTAPPTRISSPVYSGPTWPEWNPAAVTIIINNTTVITDFTIINITTGDAFTRPAGTDGTSDSAAGASPAPTTPAPTTPAPTEPVPTTPAPTEPVPTDEPTALPTGPVEKVFSVESIAGISSGPSKPSKFTIETRLFVTSIVTYHYDNGGAAPGQISLKSADGTVYGPWPTVGSDGQGGVPNAYWTATPNVSLEPGTYTVVDSSPSTWSWAPDTGGRGIVIVSGIWTALPG